MREALKNASLMLGELRTTTLAPRGYYELFIAASDELIHLRSFFGDKSRHGRTCMELYELGAARGEYFVSDCICW